MGTGASASRQQWTAADEDNTAVEDVRPRTAANANLPTNDMTGMTKLVEAKNKFLKIKRTQRVSKNRYLKFTTCGVKFLYDFLDYLSMFE